MTKWDLPQNAAMAPQGNDQSVRYTGREWREKPHDHTVGSADKERAFHEEKNPFVVKILNKQGREQYGRWGGGEKENRGAAG